MSDRIQVDGEALSALMDGELSEFELRRLLVRITNEPELLATWERYNLVRAVYQPEPLGLQVASVSSYGSFSSRIMAAIEAEPALVVSSAVNSVVASDLIAPGVVAAHEEALTSKKAATPIWTSQFAKLAVAASVALAVFVGMQSALNTPDAPAMADQRNIESVLPSAGTGGAVQLAVDAEAQQRLNDYIRSVSIPSRPESSESTFNVLFESPMLHPVSDIELIEQVERTNP